MQNITARLAQVFWGLALVAVDLRLGRFDVLPDFVGYVLVALGAGGLLSLSGQFNFARLLSWALVPVSLIPWLFQGTLLKLVWWLRLPLDGAMIWFLLGGIIQVATAKQRSDLSGHAALARLAYLGVLAASVVVSLLAAVLPGLASLFATLLTVVSLVVFAGILYVVWQAKRVAAVMGETQPVEPEQLNRAA
jgi:hypothetical protein